MSFLQIIYICKVVISGTILWICGIGMWALMISFPALFFMSSFNSCSTEDKRIDELNKKVEELSQKVKSPESNEYWKVKYSHLNDEITKFYLVFMAEHQKELGTPPPPDSSFYNYQCKIIKVLDSISGEIPAKFYSYDYMLPDNSEIVASEQE